MVQTKPAFDLRGSDPLLWDVSHAQSDVFGMSQRPLLWLPVKKAKFSKWRQGKKNVAPE